MFRAANLTKWEAGSQPRVGDAGNAADLFRRAWRLYYVIRVDACTAIRKWTSIRKILKKWDTDTAAVPALSMEQLMEYLSARWGTGSLFRLVCRLPPRLPSQSRAWAFSPGCLSVHSRARRYIYTKKRQKTSSIRVNLNFRWIFNSIGKLHSKIRGKARKINENGDFPGESDIIIE